MGCNGGACVISPSFVNPLDTPGAATAPSGCGPSGCASPSGCAGCGGLGRPTAPTGRIEAPCTCHGPKKAPHGHASFGGGPTPPAQTSDGYVPPPPQMKTPRAPMPFVPRVAILDVPQDSGARSPFVPPPMKRAEGKRPMPPVTRAEDSPMPDMPKAQVVTPFVPPPVKRDAKQDPGPGQVTLIRTEPTQTPNTVTVTALPGISLAPNPFAPYCGDGRIDPNSEFCRAASGQGVSDYCQSELLKYLAAPAPKPTLERWIAAQELCDQDALRRAANVAITVAAKASAGLYGTSGALPNYHGNLARMFRPSGVVNPDSAEGRALAQGQLGYGILTDPGMGADTPYGGASSWTVNGQAWQAPPEPATPSVDYGALVAGIGTAVGASLAGIGTIVNQANQNRLRELEIEYANNARGAQLALQRATMETQAEIQRLAAQNTPAANAAVQALQMQVADMSARLGAAQQSTEWTTTEKAMAGAAVIAGLGFFGWFISKGR